MVRGTPRQDGTRGFTVIELVVVLLIFGILVVVVASTWGSVVGARTREGAEKVATAVRYTYNLAAINNQVYALYLNLSEGTYHAGPLGNKGECERVLIVEDGGAEDPILVQLRDTGKEGNGKGSAGDSDGDDGGAGMFAAAKEGGAEPTDQLPDWAKGEQQATKKLTRLISSEARQAGREHAKASGVAVDDIDRTEGSREDVEGSASKPRRKGFRQNQLAEPRKLPEGVRFGGVVLRDRAEPVTEGEVPILFYPHGYTQRALIYVVSGDEDDPDVFTVETLTLQGRGKVHAAKLDSDELKEKTE